MILVAEDVGEHGEALVLEYESHGDAGGRPLEGNACIHQGERGAAHGRHRGRAVRLGDLGHAPDGVGEIMMRWQHRMDRAPGELAVTDLAAAGRAETASLADRE